MIHDNIYLDLLDQTQRAYLAHPETRRFAPFPDDVTRQEITPYPCPCGAVFAAETNLTSDRYPDLQAAISAAGPIARWRETYKGTNIGDAFLSQFGCYSIIGAGGPFMSDTLWSWMVYMPRGLDYPFHNHPAEEMYLVVSGQAIFRREGMADEVLVEGDTVFHASNQPHAMETTDSPVLCLVFWRDGFETAPVLTDPT
jgi:mannose-6-phosphate isomerase-like protein (cupin superfamily)